MQLFYKEELSEINQIFEIDQQENIHLTKALRKDIGDHVSVTNGRGLLFLSEILSISKKRSKLKTIKLLPINGIESKLTIAIAPTKNITRIEWFIEKSVEIGIFEIILFNSQNSERRNVNTKRLQLKSLSAMKQSLKYFLPNVSELVNFKTLLEKFNHFENKLIASCEENEIDFLKNIKETNKTIVLIGPEGGFTKEELIFAKKNGFKSVSLGGSRLRTETAGIFVCSVFNALN